MRTGSYATKTHLIHKSGPKTDGDTLKASLHKSALIYSRHWLENSDPYELFSPET